MRLTVVKAQKGLSKDTELCRNKMAKTHAVRPQDTLFLCREKKISVAQNIELNRVYTVFRKQCLQKIVEDI